MPVTLPEAARTVHSGFSPGSLKKLPGSLSPSLLPGCRGYLLKFKLNRLLAVPCSGAGLPGLSLLRAGPLREVERGCHLEKETTPHNWHGRPSSTFLFQLFPSFLLFSFVCPPPLLFLSLILYFSLPPSLPSPSSPNSRPLANRAAQALPAIAHSHIQFLPQTLRGGGGVDFELNINFFFFLPPPLQSAGKESPAAV